MEKKQNVILITIDSLRADHLGFMGYKKDISPNIDKLSKESTVFNKAFSVGPITHHSFPGILTSTYPLDYQGPYKIEKPRVLISQALKEQGYITAAFHSNPALSDYFGYNQGWDYFEDINISPSIITNDGYNDFKISVKYFVKKIGKVFLNFFPDVFFLLKYILYKLNKLKTIQKRIKGELINRVAKDFIISVKKEEKPFFAWIHYMDVHCPYLPYDCYFKDRKFSYSELIAKEAPRYFSERYSFWTPLVSFNRKHLKKSINLYDDGIKYVDEQIGDLVNFLKREGFYKNTVLVITSDHGDEFLEHKGGLHTNSLYNELLHVPLLIYAPSKSSGTINKPVSLIDIPTTISDLLGVEKDKNFKGQNIFQNSNDLVFHETVRVAEMNDLSINSKKQCKIACQNKGWKYIIDYGTGMEELYNLLTDPKEQNNILNQEPKILSQMKEKIKELEAIN